MNIHPTLRPLLPALLLVFFSCARPYQPSAQLRETDLAISAALPADAATAAAIEPYRRQLIQKMDEVIGQAPEALEKKPVESALGNFVAALFLEQAQKLHAKPVDMAATTIGGLRTPIPKGAVHTGDIYELMPFDNELVVLTLNGQTVQQLFEFAARNHQDPKKTTAIANATYRIRQGQPHEIRIGGQPLDLNRTYTLAVSDYVAGGGDDMGFLKQAQQTDKLGIFVRDAILNHLRQLQAQNQPIVAPPLGWVKVE